MKRLTLATSVATCLCLGLVTPLLVAGSAAGTKDQPSARMENASVVKPAEKCLSDLRTFQGQMDKDGYWLGGSGYGYGYPMVGFGYGVPMGGGPGASMTDYPNARPGYEVRMLVASANILARHGHEQSCEDVLSTTRDIYKLYMADMHTGKVPMPDMSRWRQQQIAAAQPVTAEKTSFRSDQLLGTDVRNPQGEALGSIDDIVLSPQTGKIAYLVIARGGIFGIDEKYVPVPWADFKVTPTANLLVLGATKVAMDAAPRVNKDQFTTPGNFDQQSEKVDAYWKVHLSSASNN